MYESLGISLALAALLAINAFFTFGASRIWRAIEPRIRRRSAATQSRFLFALRFFPALFSVAFVAAFLIPAYLIHEPRGTDEKVSLKLAAIAALSAAGLLLALWRGFSGWMATSRLNRDWLSKSQPIKLNQAPISCYRLRHSFPVVAVVGVFRRRLFIADHLFASLSEAELAAVIAHECGHLAAQDNFKRALLRACRDVLTIAPCGRDLDRKWAVSSEAAADEYAAQSGGNTALDLASALIKIARLAPAGVKPATPAAVSMIGDDSGLIAQRVKRLTQLATIDGVRPKRFPPIDDYMISLCFCLSLTAPALSVTAPGLLSNIHGFIEIVVSLLQ